jgi:RNA polymerase sigma-70 factor, ECF subfamily
MSPGLDLHDREDEPNLIARARGGETRAFAALGERYRKRVWRVVASVTRSNADTDDLAQEALIKAFGALHSYRADAPFDAWLCRIALNTAHDYQRSAWKRRVLLWDFGGPSRAREEPPKAELAAPVESGAQPHEETERREVQRRVREAVARLNDKERNPIWLIYFEEFSLAEVARLEGVPESTVRSRVKAGLKRLESSLGDLNLTAEADEETPAATSRNRTDVPPAVASARVVAPGARSQTELDWKGCGI